MKTLSELNGKLMEHNGNKGVIRFDCPLCEPTHEIAVRFGPGGWDKIGGNSIKNFSIQPSILCLMPNCKFHGFITKGVVTWSTT